MLDVIMACLWVVTATGVVLLLGAAVGRLPRGVALIVVGVAEAASIVSVLADIAGLVSGWESPELATHIGYLLTVPLITPAGFALTYKKIDRAGLLILAVAALITAVMIVRQVQTLGMDFGHLNG
ncbi:MAG: hypothetical protein ABI746_02955 [Dermatophilaceae bacterium]